MILHGVWLSRPNALAMPQDVGAFHLPPVMSVVTYCYGMADMTGGESMGHQYPFVPYSSGLAIWSRSCCGIGLTRHFS